MGVFFNSAEPLEVGALLGSQDFRAQVATLAAKLDRPLAEVLAEARACLHEMAGTHVEAVTQPWHRLGRWMLRGYDVLIDEEGLANLRALDRGHSLVFLISHRSYLDEWALPPALVEFGIEPPFGFAGANLDFFPLGTVARRTGIVHIRRSTANEPVYKLALRSYMRQLIATQSNMVWSIEGGRTRTGKLRPPRFGLLRYVADAAAELGDDKTLLVPVSIVYDQLPTHEVDLMTAEARGEGKRPEDARWFFDYLRGLRHRMGRIYVDFGEPMSLKSRMDELALAGPDDTHVVERIAVEVSHRINVATPVTVTAGVCIAMLAEHRALTLEEILETVRPLAEYLEARGWPTAGAVNLTDRATVRRALQELVASGVLTSFHGETTVWRVGRQQHLVAAMYRNSAIHVLVQRGILELVLERLAAEADDTVLNPLDEAFRLRDLLKYEFFFASRDQFAKEMQFELDLADPGRSLAFEEVTPKDARRLLEQVGVYSAHLTLRPFLDGYAVVARQLADQGDVSGVEEERFLARCLVLGQQWALQRSIASEESASKEMFRNALQLGRHLGLVESDAPDLRQRRIAFEDELATIRRDIAGLAARLEQSGDREA
jgi:glycerol-3-phosphate O-acyltransferase